MKYENEKLINEITRQYSKINHFAGAMGTDTDHLARLLVGHEDWTQPEIEKAASLLHLRDEEIQPLFFTLA